MIPVQIFNQKTFLFLQHSIQKVPVKAKAKRSLLPWLSFNFPLQYPNRNDLKTKPVKVFGSEGERRGVKSLRQTDTVEGSRHLAGLLRAQESSSWPAVRHSWLPASPASQPLPSGKLTQGMLRVRWTQAVVLDRVSKSWQCSTDSHPNTSDSRWESWVSSTLGAPCSI